MKLILCDFNLSLVNEWRLSFLNATDVMIHHGNILDQIADAIVSPANSFGFMDGGIDQAFLDNYGHELQEKLQRLVMGAPHREILVGQAVLVRLPFGKNARFMISAPTMRTPRPIVDLDAIRLSTRAALMCAKQNDFGTVLMTGMGAGSGRVPPRLVAQQMRKAWGDIYEPKPFPKSWREVEAM